jgi:hypothetical protein
MRRRGRSPGPFFHCANETPAITAPNPIREEIAMYAKNAIKYFMHFPFCDTSNPLSPVLSSVIFSQ